MLADFVDAKRWYSAKEVSEILGFGRDTVVREVHRGNLAAFMKPFTPSRRKRVYRSYRIQGAEIIRYVRENMKLSDREVA